MTEVRRQPIAPASTDSLLSRARGGDEAALRELYEHHRLPVLRLAHALLGDRDEAEDLMQDVMVWSLTHLHRYDPERAAFGTWLQVMTRSRAMDRLRKRQRRQRGLAGLLRQRRVEPVEDPMAELPARIDARGTVGRAMAGMTDMQREAIVLHDIEGWSFREMGERLGISLRTAQSRVVSAHRALQRELTEPSGSANESRTP